MHVRACLHWTEHHYASDEDLTRAIAEFKASGALDIWMAVDHVAGQHYVFVAPPNLAGTGNLLHASHSSANGDSGGMICVCGAWAPRSIGWRNMIGSTDGTATTAEDPTERWCLDCVAIIAAERLSR